MNKKENLLINSRPDIAKEWHSTKNCELTPSGVTYGSNKKVWWLCSNNHEHEWEAYINNRSKGQKCPYCSGKKADKYNNLATLYPEIAAEWHPTKNKGLKPNEVTVSSSRKIWWQCVKNNNHEWELSLNSRKRHDHFSKCPYCTGRLASEENCLNVTHTEIATEWHPTKNKDLTPFNTSFGSEKKVWWRCKNNDEHDWEAQIISRTNGSLCPFCSDRFLHKENSLQFLYPEIAKQWHPTKNRDLKPIDVKYKSSNYAWWICEKGHEHKARVGDKVKTGGCAVCSGKQVIFETSLEYLYPEIAKEWDYKKNKTTPDKVAPKSGKKYYWICSNKKHSYESTAADKTYSKNNCPYCSNRLVCEDNCLENIFPNIAREWHPIKNGNSTPRNVVYGSTKSIHWICELGHEWKTAIVSRTHGKTRCPKCFNQTSFAEQFFYFYMKKIFKSVHNRHIFKEIKKNLEGDIFIEDLNLVIEYDGKRYHQDKKKDEDKNKLFINNGIHIIRIRETGLPSVSCHCIETKPEKKELKNTLYSLLELITKTFKLNKDQLKRINEFEIKEEDNNKVYENLVRNMKEKSIHYTHPNLAKEWHSTKNNKFLPIHFSIGSNKEIWWKCEEGHEWSALISNRRRGGGCPICSGRLVTTENSLKILNLELAKEWHPTKNENLTPNEVTCGSNKKVWWVCSKNNEHEWEAVISSRNRGVGCPYCSGKRVTEKNSLGILYPRLHKEWDAKKNGISINEVSFRSEKVYWWICDKGHKYDQTPYEKSEGSGCPICSNHRLIIEKSLFYKDKKLSEEWHTMMNGILKPTDVSQYSNKKVWWVCSKNNEHEWEASVNNRSKGRGCPFCAKKRPTREYNLKLLFLEISSEWHPTRNGDLLPENMLPKSEAHVWWICKECGNEWEKQIYRRTNNSSCCPHCKKNKNQLKK